MTETTEDIPQINELLYVVKLITGEELLCTMVDIQDEFMLIESPITIRTIQVMTENGIVDSLHTAAWLPFSATRVFTIPNGAVLTFTEMDPAVHNMYARMVNRLEQPQIEQRIQKNLDCFFVDPVSTIQ